MCARFLNATNFKLKINTLSSTGHSTELSHRSKVRNIAQLTLERKQVEENGDDVFRSSIIVFLGAGGWCPQIHTGKPDFGTLYDHDCVLSNEIVFVSRQRILGQEKYLTHYISILAFILHNQLENAKTAKSSMDLDIHKILFTLS